jgi:hypothetical protein
LIALFFQKYNISSVFLSLFFCLIRYFKVMGMGLKIFRILITSWYQNNWIELKWWKLLPLILYHFSDPQMIINLFSR